VRYLMRQRSHQLPTFLSLSLQHTFSSQFSSNSPLPRKLPLGVPQFPQGLHALVSQLERSITADVRLAVGGLCAISTNRLYAKFLYVEWDPPSSLCGLSNTFIAKGRERYYNLFPDPGGHSANGGGQPYFPGDFINPRVLSLVEDPVADSSVCTTGFQSTIPDGGTDFVFETFFQPHSLDLSLEPVPSVEHSFNLVAQSDVLDTGFYDQTCFENDFLLSGGLSSFGFDSATHFDQASPSLNSYCTSTTSEEKFIPSTLSSQASAHTTITSPSPLSTTLNSPSPSSTNSSPSVGIACTWPTCTKSFPSLTTYK
jgi:hypothetical protein